VKRWFQENHNIGESMLWLLLGIPTVLWWKESVLWVALMSIYANAKAAHAAHNAKKSSEESE
jgi:hypothetical protein